jgi:hypothetical protein
MEKTHWNELKSERLKRTRGTSFKEIIHGELVKIVDNPSRPNQKMMLINYKGYIWAVPFVKNDQGYFLKTLYQSRKYTKLYRKGA